MLLTVHPEALVARRSRIIVTTGGVGLVGWLNTKYAGWRARFIEKIPVFPLPGIGKFVRQPLYVTDSCFYYRDVRSMSESPRRARVMAESIAA